MPRLLFLLIFALVATAPSGYAAVKDSIGVTKINDKLHVKYLVAPGETVYGISTKYQVSVSELLEINPDLENGLKVGQIINIPYHPELIEKQKQKEKAVLHKVQPGETLYSLAKRYNTTVDQLMQWNDINLKAGQEIVVGFKDKQAEAKKTVSEPANVASKETETANKSKAKAPDHQQPAKEAATAPSSETSASSVDVYPFDPDLKQVMVIPFDPYLYFSDADHEIAAKSKIVPPKVREIFRRRLNTLLRAPGYETIHLLGGPITDSISDLNKIYSSVSYGYEDALENPYYQPTEEEEGQLKASSVSDSKSWLDKQKEKFAPVQNSSKAVYDKYEGQYFAVKIRNPEEFFSYFQTKYSVDYFIFINQFEVKTNYENCLDRSAHNFERTFTTHYSIFDANGAQIAGNKFKTFYNSNSSYIYTIVSDNMHKIAKRILAQLPPPSED